MLSKTERHQCLYIDIKKREHNYRQQSVPPNFPNFKWQNFHRLKRLYLYTALKEATVEDYKHIILPHSLIRCPQRSHNLPGIIDLNAVITLKMYPWIWLCRSWQKMDGKHLHKQRWYTLPSTFFLYCHCNTRFSIVVQKPEDSFQFEQTSAKRKKVLEIFLHFERLSSPHQWSQSLEGSKIPSCINAEISKKCHTVVDLPS